MKLRFYHPLDMKVRHSRNVLPSPITVVGNKETKSDTSSLACGPMPNVMAALLNLGGTLGSMPQRRANLLKLAWVPQTNEMISGASGPKFTIL